MKDRPQRLWQAIYRWRHYHPIVLLFVVHRAVRAKGSIDWIDNVERTALARHCAGFEDANEAWSGIPLGERRDLLKNAHLPSSLAQASWDEVALAFGRQVEEDRRSEMGPEPLELSMVIPDELLAWADSQEISWRRPWATEVRALLALPAPLDPETTNMLLNRLDAVVIEAIRARRADLLVGFDTMTAHLLDLAFEFESPHGRVSLGRTGSWTYEEIDTLLGTSEPSGALVTAQKAKSLLSTQFPAARITAITEGEARKCTVCAKPLGAVTMVFESGSEVCAPCWTMMTGPMPEHIRAMLVPKAKERVVSTQVAMLDDERPKAKA